MTVIWIQYKLNPDFIITERPKNKSRLETRKKENFESRLENITSLLKLIHKQIDLLRSEHKLNKQEALLAEYKQLLEEALLIGNQCLINALRQRIIILEKAEVFQWSLLCYFEIETSKYTKLFIKL